MAGIWFTITRMDPQLTKDVYGWNLRSSLALASDHKELIPDWLNARVLPLLPRGGDADRLQVLGGPGLTVNVALPTWLLAMKARAARGSGNPKRRVTPQRFLPNAK
jgi:hypothetical protein